MKAGSVTDIKARRRNILLVAAALAAVFAMGCALFLYLRLGLPYYLSADEPITTDRVISLVDSGTLALNYFKYPGLNFYYGVAVEFLMKVLGVLEKAIGLLTHQGVVRMIYVFTAWLSGVLLYFPLRSLLNSRARAVIGTVICLYSMYLPCELWYAGPDTLLYAFGNIALVLLVKTLDTQDNDRVAFWLLPLWGIVIGLAVSVKYHAVLFIVYMLWIFFYKKLYRVDAYRFAFLFSLVLIPLVFIGCNLYMFESVDRFFSDFLWNFQHYEGVHQGLDSSMPLVDYTFTFLAFGYGPGGVLILLAIGDLIRKKRVGLLCSLLLLPVVLLVVLSRFNLFLSRNISFVMPISNVLFVMGLYDLLDLLKKTKAGLFVRRAVILIVVLVMGVNFCSLVASSRYQDTRDLAGRYIAENVPEGSTIFTRVATNGNGLDRMPGIDPARYTLVTDAYDADGGDVVVDTSVRYARLYNHRFFGAFGDEMYQAAREQYENDLKEYELVKRFEGISLSVPAGGLTYLPMRLWCALFADRDAVSWGPTIDIYVKKNAPDMRGVTLTSAVEDIAFTGQSEVAIGVHVNNETGAVLRAAGDLATKLSYVIVDPSGDVVKQQVVEGCFAEDIRPHTEGDMAFVCSLDGLTIGEDYTLEIDLTKSTIGSYEAKGMQPLCIPILSGDR